MTLVVPFDGSELSEAALLRADQFGVVFDESVVAVTVIPDGNVDYARERDWIDSDEAFDRSAVVSKIHGQVSDLCPSADFRHFVVGRYAPSGAISKRIRKVAKREDASMVFVGSDNAGRLVTSISSVGGSVATDEAYDVVIVRHSGPAKSARLRGAASRRQPKSDFFLPE
ncbi:Nucleotide-binding universal stress protein, UspA family [Halomicrobium zhouii]|uniref:Nucleotide-binding universal stress protein, UspA family n=1 Tax=Halomicrobium zhouii TaxID=767519 RepID=A0A1I6M320_9EURY|nr:universal stress protein [Halomicrobium zhouii]SFS10080.1 Nucleotide-binding universal stress protein, UspA family [Halomicrobium zhouii]